MTPDAANIISQQVKGDGGFIAGGGDPVDVAVRRDQLVIRSNDKVVFGNKLQVRMTVIGTDWRGCFVDLLILLAHI